MAKNTGMITVRALKAPPLPPHLNHGADYQARISRAAAMRIGGPTLPRMGYETVARCDGAGGFLHVQNISGEFYLASATWQRDEWPKQFGVTVE